MLSINAFVDAALPGKNYGFTKQKRIRGDKTLKIYNVRPNVIYFVVVAGVGRSTSPSLFT